MCFFFQAEDGIRDDLVTGVQTCALPSYELVLGNRTADWSRLKALVLDNVSSPITRRVYNLGLDEFFAWYGQEPRPNFTKATVSTWRVALEARGLGSVSMNVRITAVRNLALEAADNGLLAP